MIANITPQEIAVAKEIAEHAPCYVDRPWGQLSAVEHHGYLLAARAAIKAALVPPLPADVAGLVERLEAYQEALSEVAPNARTFAEAASTIRALVEENERLREENADWQQAADVEACERKRAHAKLREAVEVIRAARRHNDTPNFYNAAIEDVTAAFLATMEQEDSTSE